MKKRLLGLGLAVCMSLSALSPIVANATVYPCEHKTLEMEVEEGVMSFEGTHTILYEDDDGYTVIAECKYQMGKEKPYVYCKDCYKVTWEGEWENIEFDHDNPHCDK